MNARQPFLLEPHVPVLHRDPVELARSARTNLTKVEQTVWALKKEIECSAPDTYLGSEACLMAKIGVSRPTFRQAMRLLAHDKLIVIKCGMRGGLYTPPERTLSTYQTHTHSPRADRISFHSLTTSVEILVIPVLYQAARHAARFLSQEDGHRLATKLHSIQAANAAIDPIDIFDFERELVLQSQIPGSHEMLNLIINLLQKMDIVWAEDIAASQALGTFRQEAFMAILQGDDGKLVKRFDQWITHIFLAGPASRPTC